MSGRLTILPCCKAEIYRNTTSFLYIIMWPLGCLVIEVLTQTDLYLYSKAYGNIHMVYDYRPNLAVRTPQAYLWE